MISFISIIIAILFLAKFNDTTCLLCDFFISLYSRHPFPQARDRLGALANKMAAEFERRCFIHENRNEFPGERACSTVVRVCVGVTLHMHKSMHVCLYIDIACPVACLSARTEGVSAECMHSVVFILYSQSSLVSTD